MKFTSFCKHIVKTVWQNCMPFLVANNIPLIHVIIPYSNSIIHITLQDLLALNGMLHTSYHLKKKTDDLYEDKPK